MAVSTASVNAYSTVSSLLQSGGRGRGAGAARLDPVEGAQGRSNAFSAKQQASFAEVGGSTLRAVGAYQNGLQLVQGVVAREVAAAPSRPSSPLSGKGGASTAAGAYSRAQARAEGGVSSPGTQLDAAA